MKALSILTKALVFSGISTSLLIGVAKADNTIYSYGASTGVLLNTVPYPDGFASSINPFFPSEMAGKTWVDLFNSPNTVGRVHSPLVRAFSWKAGSGVVYATSDDMYWSFSLFNNSGTMVGPVSSFHDGPLAGEQLLGNPNLLSMGDSITLLNTSGIGPDIVGYHISGDYISEMYNFVTLSGGIYDGEALTSLLGRVISFDGTIILLDDDDGISVYDPYSGDFALKWNYTFSGGGPVDGLTFRQAINSGMYIGMDISYGPMFLGEAIPEPSTYVLLSIGVVAGGWLRRRHQRKGAVNNA